MAYLRLLVALARARRSKRRPQLPKVLSLAIVNSTELNPNGSVLAGGELWNAESKDGKSIPTNATVTVVGFRNHLLLVEERS